MSDPGWVEIDDDGELRVATRGRGTCELTPWVRRWLAPRRVERGLCHLFCRHTSASILLTENADPVVRSDLERFMAGLVPDADPLYRHVAEGPDDMPAHVRTVLAGSELTIPVRQGTLALGTWQGIYLWEHRAKAHVRSVLLTLLPA